MKKPQVTQAVKSAVNAYLMARTLAECERARVDEIANNILKEIEFYPAKEWAEMRCKETERITDHKRSYLMSNEDHKDFLLYLKDDLIKSGYEIKSIPGEAEHSYCCPALTAESLQSDTERLIIEAAAEMLGETGDFHHTLLCNGLDKYNQFIDLVVKMVVNMPDFKNPLTGEKIAA